MLTGVVDIFMLVDNVKGGRIKCPYSVSTKPTNFQNKMTNSTATFSITYQVPYPSAGLLEEWRTQTFSTRNEAEKMIKFYRSCGSPAKMI